MTSPHRLITTRNEFHQALRDGFAEIASVGCREVWICDDDFADWPLNERAVVESLTQWAQSHRKLTVIARTFEEFPLRHARWVEWRRDWSHVVECRALEEAEAGEMPTLLLAPGVLTLRMFDMIHHRGNLSHDPADAVQMRELVDVLSQRSIEAFPATQLGL
ncbi:MAG: hypothetical protein E6H65_00720 [Betaproteobacteria bacterium]|nr:MAG: hypothetical protein E6H65_00720 [Betaproteobacteria bacterium]